MAKQTDDRPDFIILPTLPYRIRLAFIAVTLFAGILAQYFLGCAVGLHGVIGGSLFVLFAAVLSVARGCELRVGRVRGGEWHTVTTEEFKRILELGEKTRRWTRSFLSTGSCSTGCIAPVIFLFIGFLYVGWGKFLPEMASAHPVVTMFVLDGLIFVFVIWFTGGRSAEYPEDLILKTETLINLLDYQRAHPLPDVVLEPMLELGAKKGKAVPADVRLMAKLKNAPKDFLGVQVQCSLNSVQGRQYPYVYCVILGFTSFKLREAFESLPAALQARLLEDVCEFKTDKDVDILVVRQRADERGGWHTKPRDQIRLYTHSLDVARAMVARRRAQTPAEPVVE